MNNAEKDRKERMQAVDERLAKLRVYLNLEGQEMVAEAIDLGDVMASMGGRHPDDFDFELFQDFAQRYWQARFGTDLPKERRRRRANRG